MSPNVTPVGKAAALDLTPGAAVARKGKEVNQTLPVIPKRGTQISAQELVAIEQTIATIIDTIDDVDWLEETRAQARALETYLRDKDMQAPMLGTQRRIEARIGQLLGEPVQGRTQSLVVTKVSETADPHDISDFRLLANAFNGNCNLEFAEWRKSRRALIKLMKHRLGIQPELAPLPDNIYRCIVADPPWEVTTGPGFTSKPSGGQPLDYDYLTVEQIKDMPVADHSAADAHLYLWTVNKYLEQSYQIARAWGFQPSTMLVWAKTPMGGGIGGDFRLTTEFCLFARRGKLEAMQICPTTWFNWPRGIHSEKPEEFYQLVEAMTPAPYDELDRLDLFSRRQRQGWAVWGNETTRLREVVNG
jgi:N6-adenosine-specific RNA methylase IME4